MSESESSREATNSDIILAVQTTLKAMHLNTVSELTPAMMAEFINKINSNIAKITVNDYQCKLSDKNAITNTYIWQDKRKGVLI